MSELRNIITGCVCNECGNSEVRVIAQKSNPLNENEIGSNVYWCHICGDYHEEKK